MVYSLLCFVARRNIKLSSKLFHHSDLFVTKKYLPPLTTYVAPYSSQKGLKGDFDPKAFFNHLFEEIKRGKLPINDLNELAERVMEEGKIQNYKSAPQTVQIISFAGLGPMFGIPLLALLSGHASSCCVFAHLAYGACILSFLGGSNWNEAIASNKLSYEKLGWCITPTIIGWTSLLLPLPLGMMFTSLGFSLSLVHDVLLSSYPPWMKSLRVVLTGGTLISFLLMLIFYIIL